jgi:hypothetical protein
MSAEAASPQAAAAGEHATSEKQSQRKRRWETLAEIVEVLVLDLQAHSAGDAKLATQYVRRFTVLFTTVLFVVAIAQRFKVRAVRITTTAIALALAAYTTVEMLTLPRI